MGSNITIKSIAALFSLFLFITAMGIAVTATTTDVFAQSSVRRPGSVETEVPGTGPGEVPSNVQRQPSDSDLWRRAREGNRGTVSIPDKRSGTLIETFIQKRPQTGLPSQRSTWREFREDTLSSLGGWILLVTLIGLGAFYAYRGRIRIEKGRSGRSIERFDFSERFTHWLTAVSFVILGITGLNMLYGDDVLLPLIGPEAFAWITEMGKIAHNYVAFAFMLGIILMIILWIGRNIPDRTDLEWFRQGGGMVKDGAHPPARKFNAGQKIIFWLVILSGISLSVSGYMLMVPFEYQPFAPTFAALNVLGFNLPTELTPLQEMQFLQLWHAVLGLFMIAVIIAHIYIGTLGMEGAIDAMWDGKVDENWAKEHHSLWAKDVAGKKK